MLKNFENLSDKWLRKRHCNHGQQGVVKIMFYFYLKISLQMTVSFPCETFPSFDSTEFSR
jgi:hypothetical protein